MEDMDLTTFSPTLWQTEAKLAMAQRANVFALFSAEDVPIGASKKRIAILASGEAKPLTPGTNPDFAGTGLSFVELDINQKWTYDDPVSNLEEMQTTLDHRSKWAMLAVNGLLGKIDSHALSILAALPDNEDFDAVNAVIESPVPVAATKEAIAAEVEERVSDARIFLSRKYRDALAGGMGFAVLDTLLEGKLAVGSPRQNSDRVDRPFGYATGRASPIGGIQPYDCGVIKRTYVPASEYAAAHTVFESYVCLPSILGVGVQQYPVVDYEALKRARSGVLLSTSYYGIAPVMLDQAVVIRIKVLGDLRNK